MSGERGSTGWTAADCCPDCGVAPACEHIRGCSVMAANYARSHKPAPDPRPLIEWATRHLAEATSHEEQWSAEDCRRYDELEAILMAIEGEDE